MSDHLFRWYPVALLAILAAITLWIDRRVQAPPPPRDGSTRHDPDFVIDNFSAQRMNPDGSVRYAIKGRQMQHFPDDKSTKVQTPRFVHFDPKTAPVHVQAQEAFISADGEAVDFVGAVNIVRDPYDGKPAMSLDTEFLHLLPDQDLATTDKPLTMIQGENRVTGVGMRFDNRARVLEILSHVKVTYATPLSLPSSGRK